MQGDCTGGERRKGEWIVCKRVVVKDNGIYVRKKTKMGGICQLVGMGWHQWVGGQDTGHEVWDEGTVANRLEPLKVEVKEQGFTIEISCNGLVYSVAVE